MSANIEAKKVVVEEIKKNASEAKSIVLVNYQGLTVAEDTEFRGEFRNKNVVYKVLKNTLVKRAFDEGYFHLSAFMIPAHRSAMLERIRKRLDRKERCVVVSTQLVEAGVDVDFPEVYRELAGLDSVVQAAGRCNREGRLPGAGTVRVFELSINGERQKTETWLEKMKGIARDVIRENGGKVEEGLIPAFFKTRYDSECLDAKGIFQKTATRDLIFDRFETMPFEQCALDYRI